MTYWRALATVPEIVRVEGKYLELRKRLPWCEPAWLRSTKTWCCRHPKLRRFFGPILISVQKEEEKRSDVNLATQLLLDLFDDAFQCAVIISNDTDLLAPIQVARSRFKKSVGIMGGGHPNKTLVDEADFYKEIRDGVLYDSQFPPVLTDAKGTFHKPKQW